VDFVSAGAVVFGVSPDTPASHKKFQDKHQLAVSLLSDPEHKVLEAYGAWGTKKMYGKEYAGVIRSSVLIDPKGVVKLTWPNAKSKGHAQEVLEGLQSLMK
jgi:thioredoxin-dependent peroxiredoxin